VEPDSTPCGDTDDNPCSIAGCQFGACVQNHLCAPSPGTPECDVTIGDFIWEDENGDGCQDDEAGIEGINVDLLDCSAADPGTVIAGTTTDADGFYSFTVSAIDADCNRLDLDLQVDVDLDDITLQDQECVTGDPDASDELDSDCNEEGLTVCAEYPAGTNDDTVDCGRFVGQFITRTLGYFKTHANVIDGSFDGPGGFPSLLPQEFCGEAIVEACDAVEYLKTGGGGIDCFKRQGMAALLNCQAFGCPADTLDLIEAASEACGAGAEFDFGDACYALDDYNESGDDLDLPFQSPKADPKACK
jgi:hypothetical protein